MNRRRFLQSLAAAATASRFASVGAASNDLSFSTLGCPSWDWITILDFAKKHAFAAIELRGLQAHMDLTKCPEFQPATIERSKDQLASRGLRVVCLGSSARMHEADPATRAAQMDEGRRFIDLAATLGAPYVRVFPDAFGKAPREEVLARVSEGLRELGGHAGDRGVTVLLESHGEFLDSPTLKSVLERTASPHVALLWDFPNMYAGTKEDPEFSFAQIGQYVRHTHIKDSRPAAKGREYTLIGEGDVPVKRVVQVLAKNGYNGCYSLEWEKRWHPEIQNPEVAIPQFARAIRGYLSAGIDVPA